MSRLRMTVDVEEELQECQNAGDSEAWPAPTDATDRPRPLTPHDAFIATLKAPPTTATSPHSAQGWEVYSAGIDGESRESREGRSRSATHTPNTLSPGMPSWQTPRHASIHQNAARLRSETTSRPTSRPNGRPVSRSPIPLNHRPPSSQSLGLGGPMVDSMFKILVVGNAGVGKTSLIKRYAHNVFSDQYQSTIGVDFALKVLKVGSTHGEAEEIVRLQLWDIAGQEQFGAMTRVYYKGAVGAFVVFDLSKNEDSGASIRGWKADIDEKVRMPNGECIPTVLLGSKCDLVERREWSNTEIDRMCESNRFRHWFEVSAKTKVNVTEANSYLVTLMLKMKEAKEAGDDGSVYTVASANELAETTLIPKSSAIILDRSSELLMDESCCV
eukprot:m.234994 g.234994  ORF g.234994 m.234994 type:complete len:386 (+) comp26138_c0_seq1:338-1495(+)